MNVECVLLPVCSMARACLTFPCLSHAPITTPHPYPSTYTHSAHIAYMCQRERLGDKIESGKETGNGHYLCDCSLDPPHPFSSPFSAVVVPMLILCVNIRIKYLRVVVPASVVVCASVPWPPLPPAPTAPHAPTPRLRQMFTHKKASHLSCRAKVLCMMR
jgi:hypothetical protein